MAKKPYGNQPDEKDPAGSEPRKPGISDFASGRAYETKDGGDADGKGYDGRDGYDDEYGYDDTWDSYSDKESGSTSWSSKDTSSESGYDDKGTYPGDGGHPGDTSGKPSDDSYYGGVNDYDYGGEPASDKYADDQVGGYQSGGGDLAYDDSDLGKYAGDDWQDDADSQSASASGGSTTAAASRDIWRVWSWVSSRCQYSQNRVQREFDECASLGLTDVVLHLNSMDNGRSSSTFQFIDNRSQATARDAVVRAVEELRRRDIDCHLMVFPGPHVGFTESMVAAILPIIHAAPIRSLLLDAESNWRRRSNPDFDGAVAVINQHLRPALAQSHIALGFTDFTLNDAGRALARVCDYVMPQAYSTRSSGMREPGRMQREKHELYQELNKPMVMAAAAWNIHPPSGHGSYTPQQTMMYTWDEVERLSSPDIVEIAYWSLPAAHTTRMENGRYVFNSPAESRSILQFLRERGQRVRQAHTFVPGARFL